LAFAVPRASWREIFSWKRGLGKKEENRLTMLAEPAAASHFENAVRRLENHGACGWVD
jgi:hypothetical protein